MALLPLIHQLFNYDTIVYLSSENYAITKSVIGLEKINKLQ